MNASLDDKNIHVGHRQRMRSKLLLHGPRIFDTYELLEMLLYYTVPYKDTNPISKLLLRRFSSLSGVFGAEISELEEVDGVGRRTAEYIRNFGELFAFLGGEMPKEGACGLDNYHAIGEYFVEYFADKNEPCVVILLLDNSMCPIATEVLYRGIDYDNSGVRAEAFVSAVTKHKAALAVTAHNHVYGPCYPTSGDTTNDLVSRALSAVGAKYLEHYVITGRQYIGISKTCISSLHGNGSENFSSKAKEHACATSSGVFSRHSLCKRTLLAKCLMPLNKNKDLCECVCSLLEKYGTVEKLFSADAYALSADVGESSALALKLFAYLASRSITDSFEFGQCYDRASVTQYLEGVYIGTSVETVYAVMLDAKGRIIGCEYIGEGTVNTSEILPRKIISCAMSVGAASVILAHNHPLGIAEPSEDDMQLTANLNTSLVLTGKRLEYHVVVAEGSAYIIDCPSNEQA